MSELPPLPLPAGARSRLVPDVRGLSTHILEAGADSDPLILLLHGFPELAYSWRKVIVPIAEAGFHVVAPDQRGYGRTTGWTGSYDDDISKFRITELVRDQLALVSALGHQRVHAVVGHDFGSPVAAYCALIRPDIFGRVALMSAPFAGAPSGHSASTNINLAFAQFDPPRKHYQTYYSTREADPDMCRSPQGLHAFLRAYYHSKSADWAGNHPTPLRSVDDMAQLPTYYLMNTDDDMPQTVAAHMPTQHEIENCTWLPDSELGVYVSEFSRTGFQGGLQWYRCNQPGADNRELNLFAGKTITVPSLFIAGAQDWGVYQTPGSLEAMQATACANLKGVHLIEGAGHWVQQERPLPVLGHLLPFLLSASVTTG